MRRRLLLIVLFLLLGIAVCGPLFERVDHWDHFPQHPNDIVTTLTVLVACAGIWLLLSPVDNAQLSNLMETLIPPTLHFAHIPPSRIAPPGQSPPSLLSLRI